MDTKTEELVDILNELIAINQDRIEGYEKAIRELLNHDQQQRQSLADFDERINESRVFVIELTGAVLRLGGKPQPGGSPSGTLYRLWTDVKTSLTRDGLKPVFELCEFEESAALRAYDDALKSGDLWPQDMLTMLMGEKEILLLAQQSLASSREEMVRVAS
jgi:uncharacterized protein (TIGR02284 family)